MPRKSKKSIEEPIVEVSKKVTKRTIKIPSAIAENLRKVETISEEAQNETASDTVKIDASIINKEISIDNTVEEKDEVQEIKKPKRTLHLNIGKVEQKTSNEPQKNSTTVAKESAFLDEHYMFSPIEISNKKVEKQKNEPIVNLNSTFFYEPSVFEKYSIDVTETDSPDTIVNLNELTQNNESEKVEENYVEEIIEQEEVKIEETPSLNDIISIDDESESIEDILNYQDNYEETVDIQNEIVEEEYDENYEEIIDGEAVDIQNEVIEEKYDEDYEEIIDDETVDIQDEIIEEETDESLYEDIVDDENYEYEIAENSDIVSNIINVNFDNKFTNETQDTNYKNIEEYDEDVIKESADNVEIPVGKLIETEKTPSPLFSKPNIAGVSHVFKKFSYDDTDSLNNENTLNNIITAQKQNNISDIHQVLGTFETKDQKQVTELDVVADPIGVSVPIIENDIEINLSGNYEQDNSTDILNILSPETPSSDYEDVENYEEIESNLEEYEEVEEYSEEQDANGNVEEINGVPVNDMAALTKMFESFSETISTLSNRIAELENKNNESIETEEPIEKIDDNIEIADDTEVIDDDIEISDTVEVVDGDIEISDDVEAVDGNIEISDDVEAVDGKIEISDTVEAVDGKIEVANNTECIENNIEIPEENAINEDDPTSDFLKILDSLSQTISELENSSSLDKETMENEFSTIDEIINSFTPNNEILEPISDNSNEEETATINNIFEEDSNNELKLDMTDNENVEGTILPEDVNENIEQENNEKIFEVLDNGDYNDSSKFYQKYVPPTIEDNKTLYISEETQKVYFPYTSEDIIEKLNDPLKGYSSVEEVVNSEYTVPLSEFRKPIISRFKEAYNFMRTKEKGSISESFDLALELMFNSELDPAIIRATKNLNELDTYLDCLKSDQLSNFNNFKIKYKKLKKHHK